MRFEQLRIDNLRCLDRVELSLAPGLNLFVGPNGAGKTSVLEAAYLLSHARSFRSGTREVLQKRGAQGLSVYGELRGDDQNLQRLGLGRDGSRWQIRIDGDRAGAVSELVRRCAVVCFEPGSHALIAGPAEERRRFMDWGVFHVEHGFLAAWRRYQRALKQRNALLRTEPAPAAMQYQPWEQEMDVSATILDGCRRSYLAELHEQLRPLCARWLPELGDVHMQYRRGWSAERPLREALLEHRGRDLGRGHTTTGAHRADWTVTFEQAPQREHLSRGQEKLCALACLLAQAQLHAAHHGEWPVVCLDDLASELDAAHQAAVVAALADVDAQVLITGTSVPAALAHRPVTMFHVEQGRVTRMDAAAPDCPN